jgi:N-acetyl-gamma-glutamyl-phosphate reductase
MVAYAVTGHRHTPEMEWNLEEFAGKRATIHFTPHLVPLLQGIHATVTVFPKTELDEAALKEEYSRAYAKEPFVKFVESPREPVAISVRDVNGTNLCKVSLFQDRKRLLLLSVLDNLGKGGASQAVQNMNLMLGLDERLGLMSV